MTVPGGQRRRARPGAPIRESKVSLRRLLRVASVACGIQFGWALQLSLLTPYVQELGIPHAWSSVIWLCGPLSGLFVQPLAGLMSDRCTSRFGRRRPFIVAGASSIVFAVLVIGHSADIGWLLGDRGEIKVRAIAAFVVGFWLLDVANNMTQGPCRALLADLTGDHRGGEEVYMNQREGFEVAGSEHIVCRLKKSICVFEQAARKWYMYFHEDHRRTRVANAYFSLFMAVGNVLGFATGSYSGWFKIFPFTLTTACNINCANLKAAFLIDIVFILITTYVSISAAHEQPLVSSEAYTPFSAEGGHEESSPAQEAFLWELFGTFRHLPGTVWVVLLVTCLTWIGWFPFLLFDTDWMGREVYGGKPNNGPNYSIGVRMGALGLMLNSVFLGITSVLMEKLCRKWGAGFTWGLSNILMSLCFVSMLVIAYVVKNLDFRNDLPPIGVVIAALIVFAVLGIPLAITYSVPYALISTRIESLGLGQGLSMGVLNLAIVIPQVVVSLGSGPWDQLFGGSNSPALAVAAVSAIASGLVAILAIPRTRVEKLRVYQ
ncbi:hypothetical protein RJ640_005980 [Escallonia rubra]|uniref:Sucrose transporter 4 n=1 Tax=Escallonia rubra TaxID=112253 RepID=A0AA88R957_9ASTE|nr:hypothetical protein RJ640_005980 [Escallonia rubra]